MVIDYFTRRSKAGNYFLADDAEQLIFACECNDDRDSGHPARRILGPNLFPFTSNVSRAKRCTDPRKRGFNGIS